jgi:TolB-like protein
VDARGSSDVFLFDRFRLPRGGAGLFCQDDAGTWHPVEIGARASEVLGVLVERHGELVPRDEIKRAVWPGQVIEDHNLSVQISALRRLIDKGPAGGSSIQTVPGRGYRFVLAVTQLAPDRAELAAAPPRLSIVVLPFENLGGSAEDTAVADAITDDLTSDLSFIRDLSVIARGSAHARHRGGPKDICAIGAELRVRYVLRGSVRHFGDALRVNVQLISGENGELLWSGRFDEDSGESAATQDRIVGRLRDEIGIRLIDIESARSQRERPDNPDAFDLVLRVRSIRNRPPSFERLREQMLLLERALNRDPTCVYAMTCIAHRLADSTGYDGWQNFEDSQRAERLLTQALAIEPHSPFVLNTYVLWLRTVGRCAEVIEICERSIQQHPNRIRGMMGIYHELARCKTCTGHAEEGIALEELANQLNPRSPWRYIRHRHIGWYSLLLGRDLDAIEHYERSLAINADNDGTLHWQYRRLAAACARNGRMQNARQYIARADRLRPYDTARGCARE